jgi:hypothetical protein
MTDWKDVFAAPCEMDDLKRRSGYKDTEPGFMNKLRELCDDLIDQALPEDVNSYGRTKDRLGYERLFSKLEEDVEQLRALVEEYDLEYRILFEENEDLREMAIDFFISKSHAYFVLEKQVDEVKAWCWDQSKSFDYYSYRKQVVVCFDQDVDAVKYVLRWENE